MCNEGFLISTGMISTVICFRYSCFHFRELFSARIYLYEFCNAFVKISGFNSPIYGIPVTSPKSFIPIVSVPLLISSQLLNAEAYLGI